MASAALPASARTGQVLDFIDEARRLSRLPHRDPAMTLPPPFDALTYDSYRAIRPAPGGAAGIPLGNDVTADLLPPGFYFRNAVRVEIETGQGFRDIPYDPTLFTYGARYFDGIPQFSDATRETLGFSGARLRALFRQSDTPDEFLVVQGASYFRAVSQDTLYGLSARALALGTGAAAPEEFPAFTRLRLAQAPTGTVRLHALLESPSVTGAVTLSALPGEPTTTDIDAVFFPRMRLDSIGVAPLTSMYLKGPLRAAVSDDFRPAVHDSDGLKIINGSGETIWRPLSNPAKLQTSTFLDSGPRGFGLIQSSRTFADFEDAEAAYHRRPSAWVEPNGDWGRGAVILVEIPTADEFLDNIVCFWRPEQPLDAGGEYRFSYRVSWGASPEPSAPAAGRVFQSRSGRVHDQPGQLQYIVDFEGVAGDDSVLDLTASQGTLHGASAYRLEARDHLRVGFRFEPGAALASELRLVLRGPEGDARSDVWLHRWTPARDGGP